MAAKPTAVKCPTCYAKPGMPCRCIDDNTKATGPHAARKRAAAKKDKPKRKPGRPSKLTPEVQAKLLEAVGTGAPYHLACQYAGIAYSTLRSWVVAAEQEETGPRREFLEALKKAEGALVLDCLHKVRRGMQGWQGPAWVLERRYRDHFSRPPTVQVAAQATGAGASVNVVDMSGTSDADLQKRLEQLRKEQG